MLSRKSRCLSKCFCIKLLFVEVVYLCPVPLNLFCIIRQGFCLIFSYWVQKSLQKCEAYGCLIEMNLPSLQLLANLICIITIEQLNQKITIRSLQTQSFLSFLSIMLLKVIDLPNAQSIVFVYFQFAADKYFLFSQLFRYLHITSRDSYVMLTL